MNLVALVLIVASQIFIVSCVDAGKVVLVDSNTTLSLDDMEADFSPSVMDTVETGVVYVAEPLDACRSLRNKPEQRPNGTSPFVLIVRGGCSFEYKVRNAQRSGFKAAIIYDNVDRDILIAMGGNSEDIKIQAVFVTKAAGEMLKKYAGLAETKVMLVPISEDSVWSWYSTISVVGLSLLMFVVMAISVYVYRQWTRTHGYRMVKAMPSITFTCAEEDNTTAFTCAICLEDYIVGDKLRVLPCVHKFHTACVDSWLTSWRTFCPVCKRDARTSESKPPDSERTPLLRSSIETSSVVFIDPTTFPTMPVRSYHTRLVSHHSSSSPINVSRISADITQQASPLQSSSQRSYISLMDSLHSQGYSTTSPLDAISKSPNCLNPSNASPGLVRSANQQIHPLNHTTNTLSPSASSHSLPDY